MICVIGQVHVQIGLEGVSYIVSERHELWSTNSLKLDHHFYPLFVILHCSLLPDFVDGDQQTKINQTLPNGGQ